MNKNNIKNLINTATPVIFEIGAADGNDTQEFVRTFSNCDLRMFCFEPEMTNIDIFKNRKFPSNINLFEGVISNIDGEVEFNRSRIAPDPNALRYSGSIKKPKEHLNEWPQILFDEKEKVQSVTLDSFCRDNGVELIDFIWADVQGAEEEMIMGGKHAFDSKVRFLYTEYSDKEYYEGQKNLNYITELLGSDWVLLQDFRTDALFANKGLG